MVSTPNSVIRSISIEDVAGSTLTFPANVNWATPKRSDNIAGTTLMRASVLSVPQITKS